VEERDIETFEGWRVAHQLGRSSIVCLLSNAYAVDFDHEQLPAVVLHRRLAA
jgi:hypothetical protein